MRDARVAKGQYEGFAPRVDARARQSADPRHAREQGPLELTDDAVGARHDPCWSALKHRQMPHFGLNFGHELDRRGTRAEDCNLTACELVRVVPLRRMKSLTPEARQPR